MKVRNGANRRPASQRKRCYAGLRSASLLTFKFEYPFRSKVAACWDPKRLIYLLQQTFGGYCV